MYTVCWLFLNCFFDDFGLMVIYKKCNLYAANYIPHIMYCWFKKLFQLNKLLCVFIYEKGKIWMVEKQLSTKKDWWVAWEKCLSIFFDEDEIGHKNELPCSSEIFIQKFQLHLFIYFPHFPHALALLVSLRISFFYCTRSYF